MNVTCGQSDLTVAIDSTARALVTRGAMLGGLLLTASESELTIRSAGPDMQVRWTVPAKVASAGSVVIAARQLMDLVGVMDLADVRLSTDNRGHLRVRSVGIDTTIPDLPLSSLASQIKIVPGWRGQLKASELVAACSQVRIAAARGEAKPILTGALMRFDGETIVLAATDGARLAERRLKAVVTEGGQCDVIVPARALAEIEHLVGRPAPLIDCAGDAAGRAISLQGSHFRVDALGLEGTFPAYSQLIPTASATSCVLDVAEALRRLAAAAAFASDDARRVTLRFGKTGMTIKGGAADRGVSVATAAGKVSGIDDEIQINPDHLEAGLRVVGTAQVLIELSPAPAIVVVRPEPRIDYTYIVMPYVS